MELKEAWSEHYQVHSYEIDKNSRMSIVSAVNYFQESAWHDAEALGFGYKQLKEKDRFWVLSRLYVEMEQYPVWGDKIQIETWPKGMDGLFALRDFRLKSGNGNFLGGGTSAWLIIDGTSHRLQRVDHICGDMPYYPHNALPKQPDKIVLPEEMMPNGSEQACYTDVDINNHVNNTCYLSWAINHLPVEIEQLKIHSVELNFLSEAKLKDPIALLYGKIDQSSYVCSLQHPLTKKEYCRCRINITE